MKERERERDRYRDGENKKREKISICLNGERKVERKGERREVNKRE